MLAGRFTRSCICGTRFTAKLKESKKAIVRPLGLDVRTFRRILRQEGPQPYRGSPTIEKFLGGL
jgi:hypothetical protein